MNTLLKSEDLYEWFGCKQRSKLVSLLRQSNINFHYNGVGEPITSLEAINDSLRNKQSDQEVDF